MVIDPLVIYAVAGAAAGVIIPIYVPKLFKKLSSDTLQDISEAGKAAEQIVGKGDNNE